MKADLRCENDCGRLVIARERVSVVPEAAGETDGRWSVTFPPLDEVDAIERILAGLVDRGIGGGGRLIPSG